MALDDNRMRLWEVLCETASFRNSQWQCHVGAAVIEYSVPRLCVSRRHGHEEFPWMLIGLNFFKRSTFLTLLICLRQVSLKIPVEVRLHLSKFQLVLVEWVSKMYLDLKYNRWLSCSYRLEQNDRNKVFNPSWFMNPLIKTAALWEVLFQ